MDLRSLPAVSTSSDAMRAVGQATPAKSELMVRQQQGQGGEELKEVFTEFVGQTLFGSMLASMRSTVGKPAYFHGGRTEEVFQKQ